MKPTDDFRDDPRVIEAKLKHKATVLKPGEKPALELVVNVPEKAVSKPAAPADNYFGLNVVKPKIGVVPNPRKIIYAGYMKGFVTGVAAAGGTGKTSLVDVEIASLAIGKDLLDERKPIKAGPQRVLAMSLEDPADEYQRRVEALQRHYRLSEAELALFHENVTTIMGLGHKQKLAYRVGEGNKVNEDAVNALKRLIRDRQIDVVTVDPLISAHRVAEDTGGLELVGEILRDIARDCDVAVQFSHHNRKGEGASVDDMRGAAALRDLARKIRMLTRMTESEAKALGIPNDERVSYFGAFNGKSNLEAPGSGKHWYRMVSVDLDNADQSYNSDSIGVTVNVGYLKPKDPLADVTVEQAEAVMHHLATVPPEKRRKDSKATGYIGVEIAETLGMAYESADERKVIRSIVAAWVKSNVLTEDQPIKSNGREQPVLRYSGIAFS